MPGIFRHHADSFSVVVSDLSYGVERREVLFGFEIVLLLRILDLLQALLAEATDAERKEECACDSENFLVPSKERQGKRSYDCPQEETLVLIVIVLAVSFFVIFQHDFQNCE